MVFVLHSCLSLPEEELGVILPGRHALHLVKYSRKGTDWPEAERRPLMQRWKQIALR